MGRHPNLKQSSHFWSIAMPFSTALLAYAIHNLGVDAGCGTTGLGYNSQDWIRISGTGSDCGCENACCYGGIASVSGWTYTSTCFCQQDSNPSPHSHSGSTSGLCRGDLMQESNTTVV